MIVSGFLLLIDLLAGSVFAWKTVSYSCGRLMISAGWKGRLPILLAAWLCLSIGLSVWCFAARGGGSAVALSAEMGLFPLLAAVDIRTRKVPTLVVAFGSTSSLVSIMISGGAGQLPKAMLATLLVASPMILSNLFRAGSVGQGDIRLAGYLGPLISMSRPAADALVVVMIACILAIATVAILHFVFARHVKTIPLVPFLLAAITLVQISPPGLLVI